MLKVKKHIELKGTERKIVSLILSEVMKEFGERAEIKKLKELEIYVTLNPVRTARKIISPVKLRRHGEMREWVTENAVSFSYWVKGKTPIIMLNAKERIFEEKNYRAIKGLFAHELMHVINKLDGIEDALEEIAEKAGKDMFKYLEKHKEVKPFTRERLLASFIRITTTGLLYIKDILANTRAMSFGFDEYLYENYRATLKGVEDLGYSEKGIISALKKGKKHVLDNAFSAYLGLNVSWITFKMFQNIWYKELKRLAKIKIPKIIKVNCDKVLNEMLNLRSGSDEKQIAKILKLTQQSYYNVVKHFCDKLR